MGDSFDPSDWGKVSSSGILIKEAFVDLEPREHNVLDAGVTHVVLGTEGNIVRVDATCRGIIMCGVLSASISIHGASMTQVLKSSDMVSSSIYQR